MVTFESRDLVVMVRDLHHRLNIMMTLNSMIVGGSQTYSVTLAAELRRRGHNVAVASRGGPLVQDLMQCGAKHYAVSMPIRSISSVQPVVHHERSAVSVLATCVDTLRGKPLDPYRLVASGISLIRAIRQDKIGVINSSQPGPTLVTYLASRVTRVPFVVTVHSTLRNEFPPIGLRLMRERLGRIVAISDEVKEHLINNYGIAEQKVSVIYNGVDLKRFSHRKGVDVANQGDRGLRRVAHIAGVGGAVLSLVVEAVPMIAEVIPNIEMAIVGRSNEFDEATVLARDVNSKLGRQAIRLVGVTKDTESVIDSSEVVIAIGRSALEAMACDKPVVLAGRRKGPFGGSFGGIVSRDNLSEVRKYNFSGRNGSEATSSQRIAEAVVALLRNEERRREVAAFGRKVLEDEFDSQKMAEQIENVYFEVLQGR